MQTAPEAFINNRLNTFGCRLVPGIGNKFPYFRIGKRLEEILVVRTELGTFGGTGTAENTAGLGVDFLKVGRVLTTAFPGVEFVFGVQPGVGGQ
nr:hypothetical protein [Sporomusa termitida]